MMRAPRWMVVVAAVISIPLIFAWLGGTQRGGLAVGVLLVVIGLALSLLGSRAPEDGS